MVITLPDDMEISFIFKKIYLVEGEKGGGWRVQCLKMNSRENTKLFFLALIFTSLSSMVSKFFSIIHLFILVFPSSLITTARQKLRPNHETAQARKMSGKQNSN